ncbi:type II toxin-antitoxin system RelE family toxin [Gulosibacter molinativorax]|uniref:Type II toxin-antitoxin system RelE/ParE family toxin n=1 Tax=Gulosibacter molinativorax TaxID=256821 RepID=A0ABT7C9S9_9MICO|nr:type II toxin-antitoxin system RelE/ParE family toxin [Gulosibacter molinativorax]MDJ1371549.1 type II toxin-antitoxin system RelE/ParE family toxin [Gulosibacter molinativorax]QUY62491.1 Plasmid stabilization protein [Gulosibacter molinativorax]
MTYRVVLSPAAARELRKLDAHTKRRIQAAIELLTETPRPPAAKRLVDSGGAWRVRVGEYRIVYDIDDGELVVLVLHTRHRRDSYR